MHNFNISKSLLDAVRGVLKEQEKQPEVVDIVESSEQLEEGWKYHQYPDNESAHEARKAHHAWRDENGKASGNACRYMGNGKLAYSGEFKGPKPVKSVKEEVESIDEISKKTLGSYVKKAHDNEIDWTRNADRLFKKSKESYRNKDNDDGEHFGKAGLESIRRAVNRHTGINKAVDKLTKEEVETIDEISKEKLEKYVPRAGGEATMANFAKRSSESGHNKEATAYWARKEKNRKKGVSRAINNLDKKDGRVQESVISKILDALNKTK